MLWIKVLNDGTGDTDTGNYNVQIGINAALVYEGRIEGFDRNRGWQRLVYELAKIV